MTDTKEGPAPAEGALLCHRGMAIKNLSAEERLTHWVGHRVCVALWLRACSLETDVLSVFLIFTAYYLCNLVQDLEQKPV